VNNVGMKKIKIFSISLIAGAFLGYLLYVVIVYAYQRDFKSLPTAFSLFSGAIAGLLLSNYLKRKFKGLFYSEKFHLWMIIFVQVNLFIGSIFGLIGGTLIFWLLSIPFSFLFGIPESGKWTPNLNYPYLIICLLVVIFSIFFFSRWFMKSSIVYLERKVGLE
jgi:hypothetical protein